VQAFLGWWRQPGRRIASAVLVLALMVYTADPFVVQETRLRGFDVMQRLWPVSTRASKVEIVAIDEASLRREGQWPWPRTRIADLVRRIAAGRPLVLAVDITFPEIDRFSPPELARTVRDLPAPAVESLARLPPSEDQLAAAFAEVPTVLGVAPTNEAVAPSTWPARVAPVRQFGDPTAFLTAYSSIIRSRPEISRTARSEAAITEEADADGLVRAVPLLSLAQGRLLPALGLEAVRIAGMVRAITVTTGPGGIESVGLDEVSLPTDSRGRARLHLAYPRDPVSAATVLDTDFDVSRFAGKIVLLGVTGWGIIDLKRTPLGQTQGVDIHAQLIDAILSGSLLHRPPAASLVEIAALLLAGLVMIGAVRYDSPAPATAVALGIAAGLVGGEFALFRFAGWLVDAVYPAIAMLLAFGVMLGGHLRAAQAARRRLAEELERQRELTARMEGEMAAARAIQMGLLPHRFPAFPERRDIDVYARIEPARAVGGDLFDFLLIDDTHLFFMIADVSGKGIPAALFMATTKEIVRAAVQHYGAALDRVLAEANSKTAAASSDMEMMFVTAFAGVVDLASGELVYASAGHDRPFLLHDGKALRQLETPGGPPLGVIEGYPFPIERDRLDDGAVLLLYTDGVTEAQDAGGGFYTATRLTTALAGISAGNARLVVDACFEAVRRFVGDAEQADDITVLAVRRATP
jgi:serine phosphatase RsbU (regulator of sigma subunit)